MIGSVLMAIGVLLPTLVGVIGLDEPKVTREAVCRRVLEPPVIDGVLNDEAWEVAMEDRVEDFSSFWAGKESGVGTRATLVWDDEAMYIGAVMTDEELRAYGTKRNDKLWLGDVFEMFFKPSEEEPRYYEFQVNPRSVILELPFPERGFDFDTLAALPPSGYEAVAKVAGTLDQPGDDDRGWQVEVKIPWSRFEASGGRPEVGDVWRFALCRYDYGPEGTEPVLMSSAPLTRARFHQYEDYGQLTFEGVAEPRQEQ